MESQKRAGKSWEDGRFSGSVVPVKDVNGITILDRDEHMRPETDMQSLASLNPSFEMMGNMGGFDAVASRPIRKSRKSPMCTTQATPPALSMELPPF